MQQSKIAIVLALAATALFGFTNAQGVGSKDLFRCRQSCYQKFVQDWHHCMDFEDCKNCWNNCDQALGPFPLNINSALRQESLVLTDIAWDQAITNASKQCLVTWEVSGGGLMGNLLTDSSTVQLSLWPDTVYHVQVTCKHKETGGMRRSYKLIVDTRKLSEFSASSMQAIAMDTSIKSMPNIFATETSSGETESRMRILKDSSKDFVSSYNPNANAAATSTQSKSKSIKGGSSVSSSTPSVVVHSSSPSVLRTKLTQATRAGGESADFLTQSIVFAIVGSVVLFFGLLVIYVLTRPVRKEMPASSIDKEVLIRSELLPSSTLAAATATSGHHTLSSAGVASSVVSTSAPDSRTLHV